MTSITKAALYTRVSTDSQTTENQRLELERVAEKAGWKIVQAFEERAVSGAKSRNKRPALDAMIKGATKRQFDVVMTWSVDRLGRSLQDLLSTMNDLHSVSCDIYLHQQAIDTTTPSGRALFQMCGVFAEFERSMIQERVKAGLARAKANGKKLGRPKTPAKIEERIRTLRAEGTGILAIASTLNVGTSVVQRVIKAEKEQPSK